MLISVNSVSKSFADEVLFEDVSFSIDDSDKIGFVGANGAGKSTLVKILMGEQSSDSGDVFKNKYTKIGYLEQYACSDGDKSLTDELLSVFPEQVAIEEELDVIRVRLEGSKSGDESLIARQGALTDRYGEIGGYTYKSRIRATLIGLGFTEEELKKSVSTLSGGQRTRVALAKILLSDCNLLFLDEPTNHLDIDSIKWLEDFIASSKVAFLIISHDRYFLNKVTNRTFSLENKRFHAMNLPYSEFAQQREVERVTERRSFENTMNEIERLESIIEQQRRWNREKNIKTAESKQKVVDKLKSTLVTPDKVQEKAVFSFGGFSGGGDNVLILEDVAKSFGDKRIFRNFNMHITRGERVFLLGANGCGKTTLLKIALDMLDADCGTVTHGAGIKIGYYDQLQESLSPHKRIIDEIWDEFPRLTETEVRNALAAFLFRGEEVLREISKLSGGERARVELTKLALRDVNFLILDEPTNHLDIDAREALEDALSQFEGTILAVSHDRYFINRLATRVVYMNENGTESYHGGYDYFLEKHTAERDAVIAAQQPKSGGEDYKMRKQLQAERRKRENDLKKAEAKIAELEEKIEENNNLLASEEIATDYLKAAEILGENVKLEAELEDMYAIWEALAAEVQ
ncbi:MAG: ABC-F family ATP-binding cassette domain-containing protein [Eubacteriales bacterium]|nr:ABC-F family ATP-binding cassette domain-containing protein [Eubacteriales bacterium]